MTDDMKAKLESILANSDGKKLETLMKLKNSGLADGLSDAQKKALVSAFLNTDTKTLQDKLKNIDFSKLDLSNIKDKLR